MDFMNWPMFSAVVSLLTLLCVVGPGLVIWGKLTERVSGHTKRLDDHKTQLATQNMHLGLLDTEVGRLQEWKDGYNAAARVSTGRPTKEIL